MEGRAHPRSQSCTKTTGSHLELYTFHGKLEDDHIPMDIDLPLCRCTSADLELSDLVSQLVGELLQFLRDDNNLAGAFNRVHGFLRGIIGRSNNSLRTFRCADVN